MDGAVARLTTVPFGRAATDALAEVIAAAKGGDALAPVTVVVPGNLTGLALRRELGARPGGIVNVRFMVLDRLAELLGAGALAAAGRRPLDDAVRSAIVRSVLADRPSPLGRVATATTTEAAVTEFLDELSSSEPDALDRLREHSPRGRSLAVIVERFRELSASYYDDQDLARAAGDAAKRDVGGLRDVGHVVLHLPHRLTTAELEFVEVLGAAERLWALVGMTGDTEADTSAATLLEQLEARLGAADHIRGGELAPPTVVSAPDAPGEVREAMRLIAAQIEAGRPLHRIGVVYRSRDPYAQLLDEELTAAGIPMHGPSVRTLAQSVTGRTLLGALALADDDFSRGAVVRWMSTAPVRFGGRRVRSARWARVARKAGVVRGADQWTDRLGRVVVPEDQAAPLAEFVGWLVEQCGVDARPSWPDWSDWARVFLRQTLGSAAARRGWREPELDSYDAVERAVEGLRSLAEVEEGPITRAAALSQLSSMLDAPAGRRGLFGHGVLCGSLAQVLGVDLDTVIVLGLAEGSFPPTGVSAALLSEPERVTIGSPHRRENRAADERRAYLAVVSSASTRWLLHPRAGSERVAHASPYLSPETLEGERLIASFDAELSAPQGPPASRQERDLQSLRAWPATAIEDHPLVRAEATLVRGLSAAHARGSEAFSEWEGNLGRHDELAIGGGVLSATTLEVWAACPSRYFFRSVLHVREQDDVADVDELEARHRGSLVHTILERLGQEHLELRGDQPVLALDPSPVPWTVAARDAVERVADDVFAEFDLRGSTPFPILWEVEKRRIVRDVVRTLAKDRKGTTLVAVEHGFGHEGQEPFRLTLSNGNELAFRGTIDRVDWLDGGLRVIDYKTGKFEPPDKVAAKINAGTRLQLPLYGLVAQQEFAPDADVDASYWFVSAAGAWKEVKVAIDDDVQTRFFETLDVISSEIAEGVFPANPGKEDYFNFENCSYCEFDRICPGDRDRAWVRFQDAPELQRYIGLSEAPSEDDELDD